MKINSIETFILKKKIIKKWIYPMPSYFYEGFIILKLTTN